MTLQTKATYNSQNADYKGDLMIATTKRHNIGKGLAIKLGESRWWEGKPATVICGFQFLTVEMCVPFSVFHEAVEECLGRPVYTHEFGVNYDGLVDEYFKAIGKAP